MSEALHALGLDLLARAAGRRRYVFAVAGAPGSGKSTLARALHAAIDAEAPGAAALMPMDGFHLDNAVLDARGLRERKGAPETFDAPGLAATLDRIRAGDAPVAIPVFDRALDLARAGGRIVALEARLIVIEGNYLLLRDPPWSGLSSRFDRTLFIDASEEVLADRLLARWRRYGLDPEAARARAQDNDLPNARLVLARSSPADVRWTG